MPATDVARVTWSGPGPREAICRDRQAGWGYREEEGVVTEFDPLASLEAEVGVGSKSVDGDHAVTDGD